MSYGGLDHHDDQLNSVADELEGCRDPHFAGDFYRGDDGDFYRPSDDITRGLSMAQSFEVSGRTADDTFDACFGDGEYYREPDVLKGVGMSSNDAMVFQSASTSYSDYYRAPEPLRGVGMGMSSMPEMEMLQGSIFPDCLAGMPDAFGKTLTGAGPKGFTEADAPPLMPRDPLFRLQTTTFHVLPGNSGGSYIGDVLLEFLDKKVVSTIVKINRRKYTIKAHVFLDHIMCTLKIRTYEQASGGTYAVEFQKRSGDSVVFSHAFCEGKKHVLMHFASASAEEAPKADFVPHVVPQNLPQVSAEGMQSLAATPLLDMIGLVDNPSCQAEAVGALADIAQDAQAAAAAGLGDERSLADFNKLLQVDALDVSFPTSSMLSSLADSPQAASCFTNESLLSTMLEKVQSRATAAPVQQQLAQAVSTAIKRHADALTEEVSAKMLSTLTTAVKGMDANSLSYERLQEARNVLLERRSQAGAANWSVA